MTDPTAPPEPHTVHPAPDEPGSQTDVSAEASAGADDELAPGEPSNAETTEPPKRRDPLPVLFGIGVLVLIGAVVFLWRHPLSLASFSSQPSQQQAAVPSTTPTASSTTPVPGDNAPAAPAIPSPSPAPTASVEQPAPSPPSQTAPGPTTPTQQAQAPGTNSTGSPAVTADQPPAVTADQLTALQQQVDKLQHQIDDLAQRPTVPPTDLAPLTQRVTALENRPAPAPPPDPAPALALIGSRIDTLATRLDQVVAKESTDAATAGSRADTADAKIAAVAKQSADLASLSDHTTRVARIQAAANALAAGRPLGELPDSPPALARYRTDPPPTEASLRLGFPAAAQSAEAAAQPDTGTMPFWEAVRDRAQSLVTVRRGDHVLVGDQSSAALARARTALDAGDLAGAVAAVSTLTGPPAAVLAPWTTQARALLDARTALAAMAARA